MVCSLFMTYPCFALLWNSISLDRARIRHPIFLEDIRRIFALNKYPKNPGNKRYRPHPVRWSDNIALYPGRGFLFLIQSLLFLCPVHFETILISQGQTFRGPCVSCFFPCIYLWFPPGACVVSVHQGGVKISNVILVSVGKLAGSPIKLPPVGSDRHPSLSSLLTPKRSHARCLVTRSKKKLKIMPTLPLDQQPSSTADFPATG